MAENSQAVIPDNLIIVDGEIGVPSSSPSDAGKVLTVDSEGSPEWAIPTGGIQYTEGNGIDISEQNVISVDTTVVATQNDLSGLQPSLTAGTNISISNNTISATDTTYTAGTGLSLTGTAFSVDTTVVATQTDLGNIRQVPSSTSADEDKVLTVNSSGVPEWADAPTELPTVTGNAGKILTVNSGATGVEWADAPTELPSISGNGSKVLKVNAGATGVEWAAESTELPTATSADNGKVLGVTDTSGTLSWVSQTPAQVNADWNAVSGAAQILNKPTIPTVDQSYSASSTNAQSGTAVADALSNVNQVPSSTSADDTKVLTVNSSGEPVWANAPRELPASLGTAGQVLTVNSGATGVEWATASGGTTYTAGNMIAIDSNNNNAIGVSTTAGITDIQQVAALPANPVSTVLYLIPET